MKRTEDETLGHSQILGVRERNQCTAATVGGGSQRGGGTLRMVKQQENQEHLK